MVSHVDQDWRLRERIQLFVPLFWCQVRRLIAEIKCTVVDIIGYKLRGTKSKTGKPQKEVRNTLITMIRCVKKNKPSQVQPWLIVYLVLHSNMQLLECPSFRHGRVEPDLVENGPVPRVVRFESIHAILRATDLSIDSFRGNIDPSYDIHHPEIRQKVVLELFQVLVGDRSKLIKGQRYIVLGRWEWGPLNKIAL